MEKVKNDIEHVQESLRHISHELKEINNQVILLRVDVAGLKIKSGVWGFAAGAIPTLIFFLMEFFKKN